MLQVLFRDDHDPESDDPDVNPPNARQSNKDGLVESIPLSPHTHSKSDRLDNP